MAKKKTLKNYLFKAPPVKKFGGRYYFIADGDKPIANKQDALKKAARIRQNRQYARVEKMNGEYYIYARHKKDS